MNLDDLAYRAAEHVKRRVAGLQPPPLPARGGGTPVGLVAVAASTALVATILAVAPRTQENPPETSRITGQPPVAESETHNMAPPSLDDVRVATAPRLGRAQRPGPPPPGIDTAAPTADTPHGEPTGPGHEPIDGEPDTSCGKSWASPGQQPARDATLQEYQAWERVYDECTFRWTGGRIRLQGEAHPDKPGEPAGMQINVGGDVRGTRGCSGGGPNGVTLDCVIEVVGHPAVGSTATCRLTEAYVHGSFRCSNVDGTLSDESPNASHR